MQVIEQVSQQVNQTLSTIVVVPIYKPQLSDTEERVLRHSLEVLKNRDVCFVAPHQLALDWYRQTYPRGTYLTCPDEYFASPQTYSKLMMGGGFYQHFGKYSHMLVLQTDAVALRDDLDRWMASPYDYVGAPWPKPYAITIPPVDNAFANQTFHIYVGNGGFSLRRIAACIQAIQELAWLVQKVPMDEDLFFAMAGQMSQRFCVPNAVTAASFALEANPRTFCAMAGAPPMGGHAWERWDKGFWLKQFAQVGLGGFATAAAPGEPEPIAPVLGEPLLGKPDAAEEEAQIDQALNHQAAGDIAQAVAGFQRVLSRNPTHWKALYSLFVIELKAGHLDAALAYIDSAIASEPTAALLHYGRGGVLRAMERFAPSLASYDQAIALQPDYPHAYINRGAVLVKQNRITDAVANFEQLLAMHPDNTCGLGNRGALLTLLNRNEEAIPLFARLLKIDPDYNNAQGLLAHARSRTCDWTEFKKQQKRIVDGVRKGQRVCNPLAFKALSDSAQDQLQCAKIFAATHYPSVPHKLCTGEVYGHKKLRIAYVSPDFREHPVAHLLAGVLEQHDKTRFETYGFVLGIDEAGKLNERILNSFDQYFDVRAKDSRSIAQLMRSLEIDIAVDLAGYTEGCRAEIFAWRPAPIHINYLGYPGTMGSVHMDYIMADRHVIPPESFACYTEKVIHLPGTYLPCDDVLKIPTAGITRQMAGLPEQGFVFCCFNHEYKINPDIFEVWMRLLKNVPGSVLWLMQINPTAAANLAREAKKRGVDPARLVFAQRVPRVQDHLARYQLADLFLDTTPYNAHSTASDVLRAGLPLITCTGSSFASRVASSILHAIGVPELSTSTLAAYEAAALMYARRPDQLKAVREKLRLLNAQERLGTRQFCRNLEAAYLQCAASTQ